MEITVTGRHFTLADADKQNTIDQLNAYFADLPLKIIAANVVLDKQDKRFIADAVITAKNDFTAKATVEDFELGKAVNAAIQKVDVQVTKYLEKKKHHKNGETLVQLEEKNAAK